MTSPKKSKARKVKILEICGVGWREVYEVKTNGDRVMIYSNSEKKMSAEDATGITVIEEMPWAEFVKHFQGTKFFPTPRS